MGRKDEPRTSMSRRLLYAASSSSGAALVLPELAACDHANWMYVDASPVGKKHGAISACPESLTTPETGTASSGGALMEMIGTGIVARCKATL